MLWSPFFTANMIIVELYTAVLPAVFSVSVFCRYQICWIFGISVGIVPPFFVYFPPFLPPFFQKGVELSKRGHCPPFEEKGGHCPLFDTEMYRPSFPSVSVWKLPRNTDRIPTENTDSGQLVELKRARAPILFESPKTST